MTVARSAPDTRDSRPPSTVADIIDSVWAIDPSTAHRIDNYVADIAARLHRGEDADHREVILLSVWSGRCWADDADHVPADRWARTAAWLLAQADEVAA